MQVDLSGYRQDDAPTINPVQRALIIKTFPGFAALDAAGLATLASITRERSFRAGTVIHEPGVPVVAFHLIVEGEVQMYRNGKESKRFGPKSAIGGLASLTRDPEGAHAVAVTDVFALEIDSDDMQDVFEDHYDVLLGVLKAMSTGLRQAQIAAGGGAAISGRATPPAVTSPGELSVVEKMFFLRKTSNFSKASIEALSDLAAGAYEKRYRPGDVIWRAGDDAHTSVQVLAGTVICQAPDMKPFELGVGMIVGGLDSMARQPRWYDCVAKDDVRLLVIERTLMFDVLEDHIEMAMALLRALATGMQGVLTRMAERQDAAS